nr:unnamed protein product [Callosobruchus analis]
MKSLRSFISSWPTTVDYNRPDIVLVDKVNAEGIIVAIAIPLRHNVRKTEEQKVSKYQNVACNVK